MNTYDFNGKTQTEIEAMFNTWAETSRLIRSQTQLTLGEAIKTLEGMTKHNGVVSPGLGRPDSYRGYYSDLALQRTDKSTPASELLKILKGCLGRKFYGYKGGEYIMSEEVPLWLSDRGIASGIKIKGFRFVERKSGMVVENHYQVMTEEEKW
jgi:hypothetical protein